MTRARRTVRVKDGTYYIYLRKSRKDLEREKWGEGETLARHEADLDDVCERDGYPVEKKFREVVSGESISERKEFQKLMDLVSQRKVTGVIVHAVDRLGRGTIDEYGWVLATLQRTRTLVITPGKVYDPTDAADYMALIMYMIISSGELAAQKERYRDGKNRSSKMGEFVCSAPAYGYDKTVVDRYKTLVPNDKADTVRMIFRRIANHELPGTVSNDLNKNGVKSPMGKAWTPMTIKRMIRRPVYKGMIRWGDTRVTEVEKDGFDSKKAKVRQEQADVILVDGLHEAIVDEELWQAANDALVETPRNTKDLKLRNPLAGLLFCGKCGSAVIMTVPDNTKKNPYRRYRHKLESFCEKWKSCRADALIGMVVDSLLSLAGDIELRFATGEELAKARDEELSALKSELASAEYQYDRLVDLYMAKPPAITMDMFRKRSSAIESQKEELLRRIDEIESSEPPDFKVVSKKVRDAADLLKDPNEDAEHKNAMLKQIVERIEVVNLSTTTNVDDLDIHIFLRDMGSI